MRKIISDIGIALYMIINSFVLIRILETLIHEELTPVYLIVAFSVIVYFGFKLEK